MADQLTALLDHAANPRIVPGRGELRGRIPRVRHVRPTSVMVETISAELTITRPPEIVVYDKAFDILHSLALHGTDATALLARVADSHAAGGHREAVTGR